MKKAKKITALLLCAVLLVVGSVTGTMAYLTSQDTVTNTFTVGNVAITLDEAKVDEYGVAVTPAARVDANEYKLIPGHTYVKDPTVTVLADSEEAYVRMVVTVSDVSKLKAAFPDDSRYAGFYADLDGVNETDFVLHQLLGGSWNFTEWHFAKYSETTTSGKTAGTYEFRYNGTVANAATDTELDPLFEKIVLPTGMTNIELANLQDVVVTINAHAIQADGFVAAGTKTAEDVAWEAFSS